MELTDTAGRGSACPCAVFQEGFDIPGLGHGIPPSVSSAAALIG